MILAAPLVIPFAEAVGISIATLGMAKAADMVNDYIQENPEESMKILSTIVPNIGIGQIFANKEDSDDEEVEVEEDTRSKKEIVLGELAKDKGNYSDEDAEGNYASKRGRIIRALEDAGKVNPDKEYNPEKKYQGYKRFIRPKKADGGAIGIEVLFEEKNPRQGLFMGGSPLDGQALSIYNSMNAYGFSDQEIANALQEQGLYDPNASTPDPTPDPGQSGSQSGGRGSDQDVGYVDRQDYSFNKKNYAPGEQLEINPAAFGVSFPDQPSAPKKEGIINQAIDSFTSLPTRSLSSFSSPTTGGNIIGPAEQGFMGQTLDIDPANRTREEIRSLYDNYNRFLGRTSNFADARQKGKAGQVLGSLVGAAYGIPFVGPVIEMFTNAFGPRGDKSLQSKYTVDGVGFGNTGARDEFGLATFNKKDGFLGLTGDTTRDYTDRMNERLGELTDFFGSRIEGFDINNLDAETLDKMKDINSFYTKQIQAYKQRTAVEDINKKTQDAVEAQRIQRELEEAAKAKSKAAALAAIQKQGQASYNPNIHGPTNYGRDSQGNQSFDFGGGFGIGSDGGPVSNKTGRGRTGYGNGGLATMFKEKR